MQLKVKQVESIYKKLGMEVTQTHHKLAVFRCEGKVVIKTRLSNGSGDAKAINEIRQDFRLNEDDFANLRDCPLSKEGYIKILKNKGLIL